MEGKLILSRKIASTKATIDVGSVAKGTYTYLLTQQENKIAAGKLIKQ